MQELIELGLAQNNVELLSLLEKQLSPCERELLAFLQEGLPQVCKHYGYATNLSLAELTELHNQKKLYAKTKGTVNEKLAHFTEEHQSEFLLSLCLTEGASATTGLEVAIKNGNLELAQFFVKKEASVVVGALTAARYGQLSILEWLHETGTPLTAEITSEAARAGQLEILQWLQTKNCPFTSWVAVDAAIGGHLTLLKWLHLNNCPWSKQIRRSAQRSTCRNNCNCSYL